VGSQFLLIYIFKQPAQSTVARIAVEMKLFDYLANGSEAKTVERLAVETSCDPVLMSISFPELMPDSKLIFFSFFFFSADSATTRRDGMG
jgi:hypothetical protein